MKFKAVIFDLDGTLIDSMGIWNQVDVEFLQRRNISVPDDLFKDMKAGNSFIEVAEYFIQKFALPYSPQKIMDEWTEMVAEHYRKDVKLKPGAKEFLDLLKKNKIKMGVGTSNNEFLAKIVLQANGILDYFDSIIIGKEEIKGKPFPDIFLKVASELNVKPKNCLVIEDVLVGVQAAKNAGMTVYAIYDEYSEPDKNEIKKIADFYADDFEQILTKMDQFRNYK